jgi:hypothetical protein
VTSYLGIRVQWRRWCLGFWCWRFSSDVRSRGKFADDSKALAHRRAPESSPLTGFQTREIQAPLLIDDFYLTEKLE